MAVLPARGVIAGLDYGSVRIGIALSDVDRKMAFPHATYQRRDAQQNAAWFQDFARQQAIALFVVGLPVHLSGKESKKSREAREFGKWLSRVTGVPVEFFEERFTTAEAEAHLKTARLSHAKRQQRRDALAAQMMLAAYLESGAGRGDVPRPLDDRLET
jgi:putative Holliday junction resolvase